MSENIYTFGSNKVTDLRHVRIIKIFKYVPLLWRFIVLAFSLYEVYVATRGGDKFKKINQIMGL